MEAPSAAPSFDLGPRWTAALILGVTLAIYWPALQGGIVWDDDAHVTRAGLQSVDGLIRIWTDLHATQQYYPLLHSAFWVEHGIWGDSTLGYHLLNVVLHATSAWLFVVLLRRLAVPGAALAGVLFAVHPVCVESVAWISEQKNTLSLLFYLLAALSYLRFDGDRSRRGCYAAASGLFLCALLTKSVTATLPGALLVVAWWRRGRLSWRRDVLPLVPWIALAIASGLFTSWVERTIGGAEGGSFDLSSGQRLLLAGRILWFYAGTLLWPVHLILIYPRWDVAAAGGAWMGYLLAALAVTVGLWLLRRRTRGPLAAWLLFAGTLFPALGFFNVYPFTFSYVANHFLYHAALAPLAAASAGLVVLLRGRSPRVQAGGWAGAAVVLCVLALLSNASAQTFENPRTLFEASLEQNPRAWMAHDGLGVWFGLHGDSRRATEQFQAALRLRPDYPQAHDNLGLALEDQGDLPRAMAEFREALRLKPDLAEAHNNLGSALVRLPDHGAEAVAEFQETVRLQPEFASGHSNLGTALMALPGRQIDGLAELRLAVRLRPDIADSHASLADALAEMPDRGNEAVAEYREALRLTPRDAQVRNNLGLALIALGRPEEAADELTRALADRPSFAEIRLNLAIAYLDIPGRRADAARQLDAFLQVRPPNDLTRQILAQLQGN